MPQAGPLAQTQLREEPGTRLPLLLPARTPPAAGCLAEADPETCHAACLPAACYVAAPRARQLPAAELSLGRAAAGPDGVLT